MSATDVATGLRKVIQDLVTPDMQALKSDVKNLDHRVGEVKSDLSIQLKDMEARLVKAFDGLKTETREAVSKTEDRLQKSIEGAAREANLRTELEIMKARTERVGLFRPAGSEVQGLEGEVDVQKPRAKG